MIMMGWLVSNRKKVSLHRYKGWMYVYDDDAFVIIIYDFVANEVLL